MCSLRVCCDVYINVAMGSLKVCCDVSMNVCSYFISAAVLL